MPYRSASATPWFLSGRSPREDLLALLTLHCLALVLVQALVRIAPDIYWDVAPVVGEAETANPFWGPAEMASINLVSVLSGAAVLALHVRLGGRLRKGWLLLAGLAIGACLYQMPRHMDNLLRGGQWVAALALGLAIGHLAMWPRPRRLIGAALAAMLATYAADALTYVFMEHPRLLEQADVQGFLHAKGWAPGSAEYQLYLRRMSASDATGPFGLSNVFASWLLGLTLLAGGLAAGALRAGRRGWRERLAGAAAPAALAGLGVLGIGLTRSKGAAVALVVAGGVLVLAAAARRLVPMRRLLAPAALAAVGLSAAAVVGRALLGPPQTFEGERSLLFRAHYWLGAARAWRAAPWEEKLLGLGPAGFQQSYLLHKPAINPEEVTSTHNVFVDFTVMLGVGGLAASLLLVVWLWQSGRGLARGYVEADAAAGERAGPPAPAGEDVRVFVALAAGVFVTWIIASWPAVLADPELITLGVGVAGLLGLGPWLARRGALPVNAWRLGSFAGACGLLVHNQIEMTFFHNGATVAAVALMAYAAGAGDTGMAESEPAAPAGGAGRQLLAGPAANQPSFAGPAVHRPKAWWWAAALLLVGLWWLPSYVLPVTRQQRALAAAATHWREGRADQALAALQRAIDLLPQAPGPYRARLGLLMGASAQETQRGRLDQARRHAAEILALLDQAEARRLDPAGFARLRALVEQELAAVLHEPARLSLAAGAWERAVALAPYSLENHLGLADLLWRLGRPDRARWAYRQVLAIDYQLYLDPAKRLSAEQGVRVVSRLAALENPAAEDQALTPSASPPPAGR